MEEVWLTVFNERSIASIQQQISALSTAMDDAYYRVHPNGPRQDANAMPERLNLDLPSQAIEVIFSSLDYWKRAVQLICNELPKTNAGSHSLGEISKPVTIPNMTQQASSQLHMALIRQGEIWQSLLLYRQSLRNFTTGYVTQRLLNDFMAVLELATRQDLLAPVRRKVRFGFSLVVVLGVLIFIVALISVLIPGLGQKVLTSLTAILSIAAVIIGVIGSLIKVQRDATGLDSQEERSATAKNTSQPMRLSDFYKMPEIYDTLQKGRERILIEFGYLDRNVSVTYPLVEFFILYSDQLAKKIEANITQANTQTRNNVIQRISPFSAGKTKESPDKSLASEVTKEVGDLIKDAYDFLTQIVWTDQERADQIARNVRLTYGPIGAIAGATISNLSRTSKSHSR